MQTRSILTLTAALVGLGVLSLQPAARPQDKTAKPTANKYIGAGKCKSCHGAAEGGDQYTAWTNMKHAKAFETLAGEEAKKSAAAKGIADPQRADACVKCHVTAFGVPEDQIKKGFDRTHGVQCETCHGPGDNHMKARFAAAASGAATGYTPIPADEIVAVPTADVCLKCHNSESPNYKPFCYHEFNAKVRHLNPKKPRKEIALGACTCPKCKDGCPEECKKLAQRK